MSPPLPLPLSHSPPSPSPMSFTPNSLTPRSESKFLQTDANDTGPWQLSALPERSGGFWWPAASAQSTSASPHLNDLSSAWVPLRSSSSQCSGLPPNTQAPAPDMPCSALESCLRGPIQEESLPKDPGGCWGTPTKVEEPASCPALLLCEDNPDNPAPALKSLHPSSRGSPQESIPESPSDTEEQLSHHQGSPEQAWNSLCSHGNLSTVGEDKPCDTLQMSSSRGLTFLSKEVCKPETHTLVHRLHSFPTQNHLKESREAQQPDTDISEIPKTLLFCPGKDLIEVDSLDLVFETSEPGDQSENLEAFLQDGGMEGLVYWAEPVQVFSPEPLLDGSQSQDAAGRVCRTEPLAPPPGRPTPSSSSSPSAEIDYQPTKDSPLSSSRSFSLQMSLPLTSHIVHRKDIPYETNPQCSHLPSVLRLDTSTPYRAVQSWTELQIQRNILTKMFIQGLFHTNPNTATAWKSLPDGAPSQRLAPHDLTGMTGNKRSVSKPGTHCASTLHTPGSEGENLLWEQRLVNMTCFCARDGTRNSSNTQGHGKSPVSSA